MTLKPLYYPSSGKRHEHFAEAARNALNPSKQNDVNHNICHDAVINLARKSNAISSDAADQLKQASIQYQNPERFAPPNHNSASSSIDVNSPDVWRNVPEGRVIVFMGQNPVGTGRVLSHSMVSIGPDKHGNNQAAGTNNVRIGGPPNYTAFNLEDHLTWDAKTGNAVSRDGSEFKVVAVDMIENTEKSSCSVM